MALRPALISTGRKWVVGFPSNKKDRGTLKGKSKRKESSGEHSTWNGAPRLRGKRRERDCSTEWPWRCQRKRSLSIGRRTRSIGDVQGFKVLKKGEKIAILAAGDRKGQVFEKTTKMRKAESLP